MNRVAIVTDSVACLPGELVEQYHIYYLTLLLLDSHCTHFQLWNLGNGV